jgi:hypothetical protein
VHEPVVRHGHVFHDFLRFGAGVVNVEIRKHACEGGR